MLYFDFFFFLMKTHGIFNKHRTKDEGNFPEGSGQKTEKPERISTGGEISENLTTNNKIVRIFLKPVFIFNVIRLRRGNSTHPWQRPLWGRVSQARNLRAAVPDQQEGYPDGTCM